VISGSILHPERDNKAAKKAKKSAFDLILDKNTEPKD
jgi:hypothetical protein